MYSGVFGFVKNALHIKIGLEMICVSWIARPNIEYHINPTVVVVCLLNSFLYFQAEKTLLWKKISKKILTLL